MDPTIAGGTPDQQARVRRVLDRAREMTRRVRRRFRGCIRRMLDGDGTIEIHEECENRDLLGWNEWREIAGIKISASSTIHVCINNHHDDDELLAETLVHEFAHACCWRHWRIFSGVPQ